MLSCTNEEGNQKAQPQNQKETSISLKQRSSNETNISFNNKIFDKGSVNPFTWNFIYSGGGVAIADFNGDEKPDVFLAGNFVEDKFYLNEGNFKFKDFTKQANLINKGWSTGVSVVDINDDGHLDIYVCRNNNNADQNLKRNKLYINNGKAVFVEKAKAYGLDDPGFSIQASFVDIDNDGDLDMYLVNQPMDDFAKFLVPREVVMSLPVEDKIYINEDGKFIDKSSAYKTFEFAYGLNVMASDLNDDRFIDFYISNDYGHADELLINQNGKKLENQIQKSIGHVCLFSMGSDVGDINNDGLLDIMTLDMSMEDHVRSKTNMLPMNVSLFNKYMEDEKIGQYMKNALHLNQGNLRFQDVSHIAGVESTDWSWAPLFADLDNDSRLDLMVSNGFVRDVRDRDVNSLIETKYGGKVGPDVFLEVLNKFPVSPVLNKVYHNTGNYRFDDISEVCGLQDKGFSTGMAYGDLDGDGDLDVIFNNLNGTAGVYENQSSQGNHLKIKLIGPEKNIFAYGAKVVAYANKEILTREQIPVRGYMSSVEPILHFGLGHHSNIDSIKVYWDNKKTTTLYSIKANQTLEINYSKSNGVFKRATNKTLFNKSQSPSVVHKENEINEYQKQVLLPYELGILGPNLIEGNLNGDDLTDFIVPGSAGNTSTILIQNKDGNFEKINSDFAKEQEILNGIFIDIDQDGKEEVIFVSGGNQFEQNSSKLKVRAASFNGSDFIDKSNLIPSLSIESSTIKKADFNGDGQMDVFIGGRLIKDQYMTSPGSHIWIHKGGKLVDQTKDVAPELSELGMVTDVVVEDFDGDNDMDIIVVGEWIPIYLFLNNEGEFSKQEIKVNNESSTGIWWSVYASDFDKDGDIDLFCGNLGENNKFHPSKKKPFYLYVDDYDKNGTNDIFLAKPYKDKIVPVRGKDCSSEQLPALNQNYNNFNDFANDNIESILSISDIEIKPDAELYSLSSIFLENQGNLNFKSKPLPPELQFGPIKDFEVYDINNDGHNDLLYGGNHFGVEVETVRYDALKGGLLLGDGKNGFKHIAAYESGLYFDYDVRDLAVIDQNESLKIIVANNQGPLEIFEMRKEH